MPAVYGAAVHCALTTVGEAVSTVRPAVTTETAVHDDRCAVIGAGCCAVSAAVPETATCTAEAVHQADHLCKTRESHVSEERRASGRVKEVTVVTQERDTKKDPSRSQGLGGERYRRWRQREY